MKQRRRTILRLGRRGRQVRVCIDRRLHLVRCLWREHGRDRTESWPDTESGRAEACAYADGVYERLGGPGPATFAPITLRALWERYATAVQDDIRHTTRVGYAQRWGKFELFANEDRLATDVTTALLSDYRTRLAQLGHSPNQVRLLIAAVRQVMRWGVMNDLIPITKVLEFRVKSPRGQRGIKMHEYRREEAEAIIRQWDPRAWYGWRPYVLTVLCSLTGRRARSLLHLEWRDVDFATGIVTWRGETDKMGEEQQRPLPELALEALWVAYGWRCALGPSSPFVFFGAEGKTANRPWTYSAANTMLHNAETAANVEHIKYRAFHGFRRGTTTDILVATGGNYKAAADYIGDRDLRIVRRSYDKERSEEMVATAALVERHHRQIQSGTQIERESDQANPEEVTP